MDKYTILLKEVELIQDAIAKASKNSFVVKGWAISIVAVLLALLPEAVNKFFIAAVAIVSTISFWYLDAFYLRVDRLFRKKYDWVIANRMDSGKFIFDMNPYNMDMLKSDPNGKVKAIPNVFCIMFSHTLLLFYLPLIALTVVYLLLR